MELLEQFLSERRPERVVDARRLRDLAYDRLLEALRTVDLQPGDPLSENRISRALGISRTPVREALQQLASDGMVQIIPGRAVTVAARTVQDVQDALHVRRLIEPELARLVAETIQEPTISLLQALTREMRSAAAIGNRAMWSRADQHWHEVLCAACPNQLLGQMVLQARNRMYSRGAGENVSELYLIEGTEEHARIVDAIVDGRGDDAARLMAEHIGLVRDAMFRATY
jgi:DNA-binding GntR family transcriptional regulator